MDMSDQYKITVEAEALFQEQYSSIETDRYAFAYRITLRNTGTQAAKLISRHWIILDANNDKQEVRGLGVVGEHPHLQPGEEYSYSSGSTLRTPYGTMHGSYEMEADDGTRFQVAIPEFHLIAPRTLH